MNYPLNKEPRLQTKTVLPKNEDQIVIADENYDGLSQVTVKKTFSIITKSGTATTNSSGNITIDPGFVPDLIIIFLDKYSFDGKFYAPTFSFPIKEWDTSKGRLESAGYMLLEHEDNSFESTVYSYIIQQKGTATTIKHEFEVYYEYNGAINYYSNYLVGQTFNWKAIKYTE